MLDPNDDEDVEDVNKIVYMKLLLYYLFLLKITQKPLYTSI